MEGWGCGGIGQGGTGRDWVDELLTLCRVWGDATSGRYQEYLGRRSNRWNALGEVARSIRMNGAIDVQWVLGQLGAVWCK